MGLLDEPHLPFENIDLAAEAAWNSEAWDKYYRVLSTAIEAKPDIAATGGVNLMLASALDPATSDFVGRQLVKARIRVAQSFTPATIQSLSSARAGLLQLHALHEIREATKPADEQSAGYRRLDEFEKRLTVIGSFVDDKQYILGIKRNSFNWGP